MIIIGQENHFVPEWIEREVKKIGGAVDGKPRFRVIWGGNRIEIIGDRPLNPYIAERPDTTTLPSRSMQRWHLEKLHEGVYEHVWQFGYCPHVPRNKQWCKKCYLNGGEFIDPTNNFALVQRVIQVFIESERQQDKGAQRRALMEREKAKQDAQGELIRETVREAAPSSIPRSFAPSFKQSAEATLGKSPLRQMNDKEIVK